MSESKSKIESKYKNPTLKTGLLIVLAYAAYLFAMAKIIGVPYDQVADSNENLIKGILIPVGLGSILLYGLTKYLGWTDVFSEKHKLRQKWFWVVPAAILVLVVLNFIRAFDINPDSNLSLPLIALCTLLVGFTEELLTRGLLLKAARSTVSEKKALLIVVVVFGLLHGMNGLLGQEAGTTISQVVSTMPFAIYMYIALRVGGSLWLPIVLHMLWDMSLLASGSINDNSVMEQYQEDNPMQALIAIVAQFTLYASAIGGLIVTGNKKFDPDYEKTQK